ncbi:MAG TPA: T9SS type A sorting domain-containing protein [Methylomirabilota bacterium]|nr:T9SS type A sorting domain-containing protein [Methylomirabilota bacterium]
MLPRLVLCTLALAVAGTASAQITMPEGVALSPFPVLQTPAQYGTFGDGDRGVWAAFLGAQPGSALYLQHVRADGSYADGFTAAARAYTHSGTLVNNFSAATDNVGGVVMTWFGVNPKDSTSQFLALRFQHVLSDGNIPVGNIPDTGLVVSSIASAALVVGDDQGGAYVVWEELKGASNPDIFAQHYDYWGVPTWTPAGSPTGVPVSAVVGIQRLRALVPDGVGGAYVVWADSRVGTTVPLYVAHLRSDGVEGAPWTANGVRVSPATQGVRIVGSALSPAGSLWLAWRDINLATQFNAQQVNSDATFAWTPLGALVATTAPPRAEFVPGPNGHVFVTWGGTDIRCSRLDASGVRVWGSETAGRVLVSPPSGSLVIRAAADGTGGQRIAWSMDNAGQTDVYDLHVDGTGAPVAGEPPGGEVVEGNLVPEDPVAWYDAAQELPLMVWLENGQMRVRRLLGPATGVEPPLGDGPAVLAVPAPNPWRGDALLARFKAPAGDATLSLYDLAGRLVQSQHVSASGGEQSITLRGLTPLAPGVYTLRLEAARFSLARRVVRTR